jgi:hypothetical protein
MERDTIRRIREAVHTDRLPRQFTPADVNKVLSIGLEHSCPSTG